MSWLLGIYLRVLCFNISM